MVSSGMKVIKYLLFIFNFIFFVTGAFILSLGIYVCVNAKDYLSFTGSHYLSASIILIVVGCIITIIAFFGCCGACKESHCMMITFSVLLGLIFVLELAAGITAYVMRKDIEDLIMKNMDESLHKYARDKTDKKTWDLVQHEYKCCGINGTQDWGTSIPDSCCKEEVDNCAVDNKPLYTEGCYSKFKNFIIKNIVIVGGCGIGIAFVQIIGIVCACCLASAIKKEYEIV